MGAVRIGEVSFVRQVLDEKAKRVGKLVRIVCIKLAFVIAVLSVAPKLQAQEQSETNRPRNFRVVWLEDPATAATLIWDTIQPTLNNLVNIRQAGHSEVLAVKAIANDSYSYAKKSETDLVFHRVELKNLTPATKYELEFVSDEIKSPLFHFTTAADDDRPLTLLFGGDSRTDQAKRRAMNELMASLVEQGAASDDPADEVLGLVHAGDYVATGTDLEQWSRWLGDHELTITSDGRLLPLIPARGNHDRGRLFNEAFGFDVNDQHNWYGVSFGDFLRVTTLNTEASAAGRQSRWLSQELSENRSKHRWHVVQYHRPAYAATKWPSSALIHWVPQFERHTVDLVCEGDGHTIKRTVPIRNRREDPTGIVYVGEGGLGVPPRQPKPRRWYLQSPGMCGSGHHVQRLKFTADKLIYECVLLSGEIADRWEKVK